MPSRRSSTRRRRRCSRRPHSLPPITLAFSCPPLSCRSAAAAVAAPRPCFRSRSQPTPRPPTQRGALFRGHRVTAASITALYHVCLCPHARLRRGAITILVVCIPFPPKNAGWVDARKIGTSPSASVTVRWVGSRDTQNSADPPSPQQKN